MNDTDRTRRQVALDEAAQWHVILQDPEPGDAELQAWSAWLEASPENAQAFDDISRLWEAAGQLDDSAVTRARAEAAAAATAPAGRDRGTASAPPAPRTRGRRATFGWAAGLAAVLVLACTSWLLGRQAPVALDQRMASTAIGEQRQLQLGDGSTIDLDAASEVVVQFSRHARVITLLRGRAYFDVAHEPGREFSVVAGDVTSRAVGTAFAVARRDDGSITVTVAQGRVRVESPASGANPTRLEAASDQQIAYSPALGLAGPEALNAGFATAWRSGTVVYQSEPLARVIDDLNRHSPRPIRLLEPSLAAVEVTGLWQLGDIDAWIDGLAKSLRLDVVVTAEAIELRPAAQDHPDR